LGLQLAREFEKLREGFIQWLPIFSRRCIVNERVRRPDGTSRWGIYRDTEHPDVYLETFIVHSWAEHLRQHERFARADHALEERISSYVLKEPKVRHLIYAASKP